MWERVCIERKYNVYVIKQINDMEHLIILFFLITGCTEFKHTDFKENLMRFFESLRYEAADTSVQR